MGMHRASGYTRNQILSAIKTRGAQSADALSRVLGISPVAVRQHLAALESDGIIHATVERRAIGRPVHLYALTEEGDEDFPRGYDTLANAFLDEVRDQRGSEGLEWLLGSVVQRQLGVNRARMADKGLRQQVEELARIQTEAGYMADSAADNGSCLLTEHNCAICHVAKRNRELCGAELRLFQELLGEGVAVVRERYIMDGDNVCQYRITPHAATAAGAPVGAAVEAGG